MMLSRTRTLLQGQNSVLLTNSFRRIQLQQRSYSSALTAARELGEPGKVIHGFTVQRIKEVPELALVAVQLKHNRTGGEYIHVARDDKNNVFSVGFKTNPPDDSGLPHILEHTTLCGSKKYPVRDPFFKMLNRSLSNFMNAFTSSDHTTYPFATTNRVDFKNLMDVYLDATLNPLLKTTDFKQEGWRIGPEDPKDPGSPLKFKGVVYNEMKGQMSDSSYVFLIRHQDHIFPAIHNSGGDPASIPDLTVETLRKFHADHYHPSNAKVITYGDMPVEDHLKQVNEKLEGFEPVEVDQKNLEPITLNESISVTVPGPFDPLVEKVEQYKTSLSWIANDTTDVHETFAVSIVSSLLLDGYGSPMYKGLIDEKLGADFSPNTGYDPTAKKGIFSIGLQRVREENVEKVKEAILDILKSVKESGFEKQKVDGILHQLELGLKHKSARFGLGIINRINGSWFKGSDPFNALMWDDVVSRFKELYNDGKSGYLEGILEKYFINKPTFTFTMTPDPDYDAKLAAEETERLESEIAKKNLGEETVQKLAEEELALLKEQEAARTQPLDALPSVHVKDIQRSLDRKEIEHDTQNGIKIQWRKAPTNGLTYFKAITTFKELPEHLRLYLPLFTDAIFRLGTKAMSMPEIEDQIKLKTGGISVSPFASANHTNLDIAEEGLSFSGYCLDRNVPDMYSLLQKVLLETNFNQPTKLGTMIQGTASGLINNLAESGHSYARTFAAAHLTKAGKIAEVTGGMTQVRLLSKIAADQNYGEAILRLKEIAEFAASRENLRVALTCSSDAVADNERHLASFVSSLPKNAAPVSTLAGFEFDQGTARAFFPLPFQVNYSSLCLKTVPYTHDDSAALSVLSQLLTHKYLHHEIREKGGAYGGGSFQNSLGGVFGYYSYRDPNIPNTLKVIGKSGRFALEHQWTAEELEGAKLSIFQGIDAPQSVNEEGMTLFTAGITDDMRQRRREQLLDVTADDIRRVAQKYIVDGLQADKNKALAVLGEKGNKWVNPAEGWQVLDLSTNAESAPREEFDVNQGKVEL